MILILISALSGISPISPANAYDLLRLSDGLPRVIPLDYLNRQGFVDFGEDTAPEMRMRAPIGSRIRLDGKTVSPGDRAAFGMVLTEGFLATLPPRQPIVTRRDPQGREIWDYPIGTEVAHRVEFVDVASNQMRIHELRLLRKIPGNTWAYGLYTVTPEGLTLNREEDPTSPPVDSTFLARSQVDGRSISVSISRIHAESCLSCHGSTTASPYQYPSLDRVGPCGFVPANPVLKTDWASKYEAVRGESPFSSVSHR